MQVIEERAKEKAPSLLICVSEEQISLTQNELGLAGSHQKINAALAVSICNQWIKVINNNKKHGSKLISLDDNGISKGLKDAFWPGRCQTISLDQYPSIVWYLDGAHTPESLKVCSAWFSEIASDHTKKNALIFNCTHERQGALLFPPLIDHFKRVGLGFAKVIFCTNDPYTDRADGDLANNMIDPDPDQKTQHQLKDTFSTLAHLAGLEFGDLIVVKSVQAAADIAAVSSDRVLVTGSLHLVGSALSVLKQDCR